MKPFNLEEAKAGKPIVTRDGEVARFVAHVPEASERHRVIFLHSTGFIGVARENGGCLSSGDGMWDLFMVSEKVSGWVNLYKDRAMLRTGTYVYGTKEEAKTYIECGDSYLTTFYVELEV